MGRITIVFRLLILTCCLLALGGFRHTLAAVDAKATEQQLQTLKKSIGELRTWLDSAKGQQSQLQKELKQSEIVVGKTASKIRNVANKIDQTQTKLKQLEATRRQLLNSQHQQEQRLAYQIRAAYSIGRQEYLKVLLNQEQPDQVARALTYYGYFNRARTEQIEAYRETLTQLQTTEADIDQENQVLQQEKQQLEEKRAALSASKQKRQQVLLQLEGNIQNKDQELAKLLADRKRLEELLEAVKKTLAELKIPVSSAPITQLKGRLPWPAHGNIVRRFGSKDSASSASWNGVLIAASEGAEVTAVHSGRVVFADWLRGFGLLIIIDHGNGYMSLYGHNQTLYKETGDWVASNQVIASVGDSGGRKNAGLYFEIRHNGQPQNPQHWILTKK